MPDRDLVIGDARRDGALRPDHGSAGLVRPERHYVPISYVILKSTSLAPLPDPVVYFQGGPGGSALNSFAQISGGTAALRASRDVIFFDQRGTAHSNELYCPPDIMAVNPETYDEDIPAADARTDALGVDAYSDPDAVLGVISSYWDLIDRSRCLPLFAERGIELEHYKTASTVRDTIALMEQFGYPSYNLYGGSYGTTVVLEILDHYERANDPDLPSIRTAVLDSVAPRDTEFYELAFDVALAALRVFDTCEQDPACAASYPNSRATAVRLLASLQEQPISRDGEEPITVEEVAEVMRSAVTNQTGLLPYIPRLVAELERGETAVFDLAGSVSRYEVTLPDAAQTAVTSDPASAMAAAKTELEAFSAQLDEIKESYSQVLFLNALMREAALEAEDRADLIVGLFDGMVSIGGSAGTIFVTKLKPYILHREQRTRAGLETLIRQAVVFPGLQSEMLELTARLDDSEVRDVFAVLTSPAFEMGLETLGSITNRTVFCNDRGPNISHEVAYSSYLEFEAPQLIGVRAYWPINYQISCEQLGLGAEIYAPPPPPVVSDVRTLVVTGSIDVMTPAVHAYQAAETLTNATLVEIPMASHVPGLFTECGQSLVHAFILSPDVEPNLACVEAARPTFVMPDDELPE
ncbi:alpha/beta fold hydrolase [Roseovarius aestuariivivens]|uniref:alpha/beta fold hydrolase n=1 Tax=Roseovarius aestuariivivens TaxID=1888910 RepID=UPI0010816432|nr:alpha/beta fold hydrolase [Roseovarius aestuariivivens]